jgi:hypothetical protein
MSGKIVGILGQRGGGKTLLMTHLAYMDYEINKSLIVSNYHLNFDYKYMTLSELAELPDWLKDATVCLDEIQVGADSRSVFAKGNKSISTLATQLRKRNITLYYTTQLLGQVDKRLREQTDYIIITKPLDKNKPGWFRLEIYDKRTDFILGEKFFWGKETFQLYNTNEVILYEGEKDGEDIEEIEEDIEFNYDEQSKFD